MPSALAFIGGGLLEGVGKGLVESGKEKRERALADLAHQRNLDRDKANQKARRGLLDERLRVQQKLAGEREDAAGNRLGQSLKNQSDIAGQASRDRREIASQNRDLREKLSEDEIAFRKAESKLTRDLSAKQLKAKLEQAVDLNQATIDAAQARLDAGFGHSENLNQATIDAAQSRLDAQLESRGEISANEIEFRKAESKLTRDLSAKQLKARLKQTRELSQDTIDAAQKRLDAGFGHSETLTQQTIDAAQVRLDAQLVSREGIAERGATADVDAARLIAQGKDTTAAEARVIAEHLNVNEFGEPTGGVDHRAAGIDLRNRGFIKGAEAQERMAQQIETLDNRRRAEAQADAEVDEKAGVLSSDATDFKADGGSRVRFRARRVREIMRENEGRPAPTREAATPGPKADPAALTPGRGRQGRTSAATPEFNFGPNPYVGSFAPPDHPEARQGKGDFWYIPDPANPGSFMTVQTTDANRSGPR